jgi:hypothetical protein
VVDCVTRFNVAEVRLRCRRNETFGLLMNQGDVNRWEKEALKKKGSFRCFSKNGDFERQHWGGGVHPFRHVPLSLSLSLSLYLFFCETLKHGHLCGPSQLILTPF